MTWHKAYFKQEVKVKISLTFLFNFHRSMLMINLIPLLFQTVLALAQ